LPTRSRTRKHDDVSRRDDERRPVLTPRFVVVMVAGVFYFSALGTILPVVPRYVDKQLGGDDVAVGLGVGAVAIGAILLRPLAGRFGDRFGRRWLMVIGALTVAVMTACAGLVQQLEWLVITRIVFGFGEACFFVGSTTMTADLAPEERRGEAVSYFSITLWGGLALGPVLGEVLLDGSNYDLVWFTAAGLALGAAIAALFSKETHVDRPEQRGRLIAREAIRPGVILAAVLIGVTGFSVFMPLYAPEVGVHDVGALFLIYGVVVLTVRIFGARLPDRLGPVSAGSIAIASAAGGLGIVAAWQSTVGLVVGTVVLAVGSSFLYPAMLLLVLRGVPDHQRGSVVGTFSAFFDFASGAAGIVLGAIAGLTSYAGAFGAAALLAVVALVLLRSGFGGHEHGATPTVAELGTVSVEPTAPP
jgi:MFS family permease